MIYVLIYLCWSRSDVKLSLNNINIMQTKTSVPLSLLDMIEYWREAEDTWSIYNRQSYPNHSQLCVTPLFSDTYETVQKRTLSRCMSKIADRYLTFWVRCDSRLHFQSRNENSGSRALFFWLHPVHLHDSYHITKSNHKKTLRLTIQKTKQQSDIEQSFLYSLKTKELSTGFTHKKNKYEDNNWLRTIF